MSITSAPSRRSSPPRMELSLTTTSEEAEKRMMTKRQGSNLASVTASTHGGGSIATSVTDYQWTEDGTLLASYTKQGHVCCGCCCDTRRASMIVNAFQYWVNVLFIGAIVLAAHGYWDIDDNFRWAHDEVPTWSDDKVQENVDQALESYHWVLIGFLTVSALMSLSGLVGAYYFHGKQVLYTAWWYALWGIVSLVTVGWGGIGVFYSALLAYPNVMFFQEMREGLLTPTNYYLHEQYSCCCLPSGAASGTDSTTKQPMTVKDAIENRLGFFS